MKSSRFLVRMLPKEADRGSFLASVKTIGHSLGASVKHPRWTSYGALEVDVFVPSAQDFQLLLAALEPLAKAEFTKNLDEAPPFKEKEGVLEEARGYFNSERYWECHETLESVWRPAKGEEKSLVQAVILVCAALVHEQRGERDVALGSTGALSPRSSGRSGRTTASTSHACAATWSGLLRRASYRPSRFSRRPGG